MAIDRCVFVPWNSITIHQSTELSKDIQYFATKSCSQGTRRLPQVSIPWLQYQRAKPPVISGHMSKTTRPEQGSSQKMTQNPMSLPNLHLVASVVCDAFGLEESFDVAGMFCQAGHGAQQPGSLKGQVGDTKQLVFGTKQTGKQNELLKNWRKKTATI